MDPLQIVALIAELAPELLSFAQAIITAIENNNPPATADKAMPMVTPEQKALLTSLLATHRDMHAMLCDAISKRYGITV